VKCQERWWEAEKRICGVGVGEEMKLGVQDQGEDQRGPGKRLFERTVKHVS